MYTAYSGAYKVLQEQAMCYFNMHFDLMRLGGLPIPKELQNSY